jgi:hypothetical protein
MDLEDSKNESKNEESESEGKYDESAAFSHPEHYIE